LQSLFRQIDSELPDTELIVIDGGSTVGTVDLLKQYNDRISYWLSEPDNGVADAFNKGLRLARGKIIRAVGDDDQVIPGGLATIVNYLVEHPECDAVGGHNHVFLEDPAGKLTTDPQTKFTGDVSIDVLRAFPHGGVFIPECVFFRREVLEKHGGYDESFRYWGYLDFFFRLIKAGVRIRIIPENILITYQTPVSDSIKQNGSGRWIQEWTMVQKRHSNLYWKAWHAFGQEFKMLSPIKWIFRRRCLAVFKETPRPLYRRLLHRFR
jgi:glycosyltransferase involved in cell wall biosynthesis